MNKDKFFCVSEASQIELNRSKHLVDKTFDDYICYKQLYNLSNKNLLDNIKRNISYPWFEDFVEGAINWLYNPPKEKFCLEKTAYDYLNNYLQEAFETDRISITDIVIYGYSEYGYRVEFITEGHHMFYIEIPKVENLSLETMNEFELGKIKFGYVVAVGNYKFVTSSYNIRDFQDKLNELKESHIPYMYVDYHVPWVGNP